ncbi:MAG: hypothetical protein U0797_13730 [Gemmataceae bacterium]
MLGGDEHVDRVSRPGCVFQRGYGRALDAVERSPAVAGQRREQLVLLRPGPLDGLGGGPVDGVAGQVAGEQLVQVGDAVAVGVLAGDGEQPR